MGEDERKKLCDEIFQGAANEKDKAHSISLVRLGEIERKLRHIVEGNNLTQNYLKKKCADNVWRLMHNVVLGSRNTNGFNWLQQQNHKINHRRVAFVGVRDKENKNVMDGKGLRSPLDTLFTEMLRLEKCMNTRNTVRDLGVPKTMERIIKQFRDSFAQEYLDEKDRQCQTGKWVPPIMVSWDVDSIDPRDCPCVMRQEAHGLSAEESLSFAEEIANTEKLVFWETVEFNPDLWEGYRDERVQWSLNEFELGSYQRRPRQPTNKNQHRMDREASTK